MSKHTPGDLVVAKIRDLDKEINITCTGNDGWEDCRIVVDRDDCDTKVAEANAAHLALCWNAHDDLREACEDALGILDPECAAYANCASAIAKATPPSSPVRSKA